MWECKVVYLEPLSRQSQKTKILSITFFIRSRTYKKQRRAPEAFEGKIWIRSKLRDYIFCFKVAARPGGRFATSDGCTLTSRKLRNLTQTSWKIRNPKHKIRNNPECQKTNTQIKHVQCWVFKILIIWILYLFRISDFDIRFFSCQKWSKHFC